MNGNERGLAVPNPNTHNGSNGPSWTVAATSDKFLDLARPDSHARRQGHFNTTVIECAQSNAIQSGGTSLRTMQPSAYPPDCAGLTSGVHLQLK
jgi:hypothetical protein